LRINVPDHGEVEFDEDNILHFDNGLFAFENEHDFVLLNYDFTPDDNPIKCLQSISGGCSFTVLDPFCFLPAYKPQVSPGDKKLLACQQEENLRYLVIAIVKRPIKDTVGNLRCPLVLTTENQKAVQVILENEYSLKYQIFAPTEAVTGPPQNTEKPAGAL
jgi:flagellar assembly factor FliW